MKNLFYFAAVAAAMVFSSCNTEDEIVPEKQDILAENVASFGKRSSSVDVTIGSKKGFMSRGCDVNGNMWSYLPEYPSSTEISEVMAYIGSQVNPTSETWPGWTFYYVQHVDGAHHKYSYKDWNGAMHDNIDGTASMEHLQILENSGSWAHAYNFNAGKCDNAATHNAVLMTDGFHDAKTLNEYSSSTISKWCLFKYKGEYYLGFDFDSKKGDGEIPGDGIYDDWVMKIVPGVGEKDPDGGNDGGNNDGGNNDGGNDGGNNDGGNDDGGNDGGDYNSKVPSVEVDVHHQDHKDWNEIKTSIHLRDTVNVRVFIPVEKQYQAVPDDFDIRTGEDYTYLEQETKEVVKVKYTIASKEFYVDVQVNHRADGIEILLAGADCAEALRYARGIYGDGLTFEVHSYLYPNLQPAIIWNDILKNVPVPETSLSRWPSGGSCITHTYGQVHSAYYEDQLIPFVKDPK